MLFIEVLAEEDAVFVGEGEPGLAAGAVRGSGEDEAEVPESFGAGGGKAPGAIGEGGGLVPGAG